MKIKAVTITAPQQAAVMDVDFDDGPPRAGEIIGRTLVTLVSPGTEINYAFLGPESATPGVKYPIRPGYAAVCQVESVGEGVAHCKVGDIVFSAAGHASRHRVAAPSALSVPDGLAPEVAVFARLMGVSWTTLVTTTARPPDRVLVTGLGVIGNLAAQIFQAGGYRVTGMDPIESRRSLAARIGIKDVQASVPKTGGEYALAVECSGHEQAALEACRVVRKRGEVVLVGCPWRKRTDLPAFDVFHAVFHRYVVLRSGWEWEVPSEPRDFTVGSIPGNLTGALDWLKEGRIRVDGLYRLASPADAQSVYQDLLHQRGQYLSTVLDWRKH